jgi:uncharacterized protein YndB with AHSA1/START domain
VETSVVIKAQSEKVWEMLALDRMPEWMDDLKSSEYITEMHTPEDRYKVGTIAHWMKVDKEDHDMEITESLENEKIVFRTSPIHGVRVTATFTLKPTEAGTEMTYAADYTMPWGVIGKFLDKVMMKKAMLKDIEGEAKSLKTILEK